MNFRPIVAVLRNTRLPLCVITSLSLLSAPLAAQGGMGGGMGGDMGGRGGMGGPPPGGMKSPAEMVRTSLESSDPMKFLLDNKKPLALTSSQQDTMKRFRKEMQDMQKPVFKELETLFGEAPSRGRGMGAETRGMGGGPPGGGREGGFGEPGSDSSQARGLPEPAKKLVDKLADIQDSYRDRARAQLTQPQRVQADSIEVVWLAKQRKKNPQDDAALLPSDILRENLYYTDPIRFMLDLGGSLSLTAAQRDSMRQYGRELQGKLHPVFKQLETVETPKDGVEPSERVLVLADQLLDLQDEYRQRTRALLTRPQRAQADLIELAWLTEQRRRIEAQVGAR